ncbi:MAG: lytic transglycosylase domain-containing protein, partial [Actinobacteria bacterium]|nr:lytic transglycosylase domain-containing protein [Actinomycetota bacterium]
MWDGRMGATAHRHRIRIPVALALLLAVAGTAPSGRHADPPAAADQVSSPSAGTGPAASVTRIEPRPYPFSTAGRPAAAVRISSTAATGQGRRARVDIADVLLKAYRSAVASSPAACHLPVSLLAAIGQVESGSLVGATLDARHRASILGPVLDGRHGFKTIKDTDNGRWDQNTRWDRAVGPLQLIPSTWRRFGVDGDRDGVADPQDVEDATATAAAYLCYGGRDLARPATLGAAVLAYNSSAAYERLVLTYQRRFAALGLDNGAAAVGVSSALAPLAIGGSPVAGVSLSRPPVN